MREDIAPEELAALSPRERTDRAAALTILHKGAALNDADQADYFARVEQDINEGSTLKQAARGTPTSNQSGPSTTPPPPEADQGALSPLTKYGIKFSSITPELLPTMINSRRDAPRAETAAERVQATSVLAVLYRARRLPKADQSPFFTLVDSGISLDEAIAHIEAMPERDPSKEIRRSDSELAASAVLTGFYAEEDAMPWSAWMELKMERRARRRQRLLDEGKSIVAVQSDLSKLVWKDTREIWQASKRRSVIKVKMLEDGWNMDEFRPVRSAPPSLTELHRP